MKLKHPRLMRIGEIKQVGDQYKHEGRWHDVGATLGTHVGKRDIGLFRTRRPLPKFYAR